MAARARLASRTGRAWRAHVAEMPRCFPLPAGAAGFTAYQNADVGDISKGVWGLLTKQGDPSKIEVGRSTDSGGGRPPRAPAGRWQRLQA